MAVKSSNIGDRIFDIFNIVLMALVFIATLYPFWYIAVASVSSIDHIIGNTFLLWPNGFHWDAYKQVFRNDLIPAAYRNTVFVTVVGTALSMTLSVIGAYVLSVRDLPGRTGLTFFVVFCMLFGGGMVPYYLVVSATGLINSIWSLIIPGCISSYNVILLRNFFQNVPQGLYEAAVIDGIRPTGYLFRILLPLSTAVIATVTLFYAVSYWNDYFTSILFIRDRTLWPVQRVLREALLTAEFNNMMYEDARQTQPPETIKNAMIVVAVLPILCVYPFIQKYFVKGVMIGSMKG
ncbi:MAG: carbohydrate ABC transporter permease [Oscillospiraceae bacterium]|jgi:putative aldouronate transport system permease protein|nr:carbohydrate ABC transporter permease [Oscillospiraceae bacterium]